jgi:hypothetical protein
LSPTLAYDSFLKVRLWEGILFLAVSCTPLNVQTKANLDKPAEFNYHVSKFLPRGEAQAKKETSHASR